MKRIMVLVPAALLAGVVLTNAQTFGDISGTVIDPSAAAIAGATVTATNLATNAVRTTVSNDAGVYGFPSLPPGRYSVKVEKEGFRTAIRNVEIQVQQSARADFVMVVGK